MVFSERDTNWRLRLDATLYKVLPYFTTPLQRALENIVENGKNAVTSIFSFFHYVYFFLSLSKKSDHLTQVDLVVCIFFQYGRVWKKKIVVCENKEFSAKTMTVTRRIQEININCWFCRLYV